LGGLPRQDGSSANPTLALSQPDARRRAVTFAVSFCRENGHHWNSLLFAKSFGRDVVRVDHHARDAERNSDEQHRQ
jgi:hypothetical protein